MPPSPHLPFLEPTSDKPFVQDHRRRCQLGRSPARRRDLLRRRGHPLPDVQVRQHQRPGFSYASHGRQRMGHRGAGRDQGSVGGRGRGERRANVERDPRTEDGVADGELDLTSQPSRPYLSLSRGRTSPRLTLIGIPSRRTEHCMPRASSVYHFPSTAPRASSQPAHIPTAQPDLPRLQGWLQLSTMTRARAHNTHSCG